MQRQSPGLYVYAMYLEDGTKIQSYVTTEPPPQVGEWVPANEHGTAQNFEVRSVRYDAVQGFDVVILTVRPVADL